VPTARETGHGRYRDPHSEGRSRQPPGLPARPGQAIKITRWRKDTGTGKTSRETVYAVTQPDQRRRLPAQDLARLVREHWSIEAHHHVRDVTFREDTAASRTGRGPVNLATIPRRRHRGHQRRRLPARPRRPPRPTPPLPKTLRLHGP